MAFISNIVRQQTLEELLFENQSPLQIDQVGADTYIGYAKPGSLESANVWAIKKVSEVGNRTLTKWADGNKLQDNIYNNRLTLTYS